MTDQQPDALNAPTVPTVPTSIITPSDDSDSATDERAGTPILPDYAYTDDEDTEVVPDGVRALCEQRPASARSTAAAQQQLARAFCLLRECAGPF